MTIGVGVAAADAPPVMAVRTPLGVHLPEGLVLRIDASAFAAIAFTACDADGCRAEAEIGPQALQALSAGRLMSLTMHTAPDQTMTFDIPLGDFADAYVRIR